MKPCKLATIRVFETANFRVEVDALEDFDTDLSFDEDGSIRAGLESGSLVAFTARAQVIHKETGAVLASDFLGGCIYQSIEEFEDHRECAACQRRLRAERGDNVIVGSYFSDMVRMVCREARGQLAALQRINVRPGGTT